MKIINHTHWSTAHLRAFVLHVAQDECEPGQGNLRTTAQWRKQFKVIVKYGGRFPGVSGRAPYHGAWMKVFVSSTTIDRIDLAHTIAHEFAHTRGLRHNDMRGARYSRVDNWRERYAWADTLPLEIVQPKVKAAPGPNTKLAHVERMLRLATTREKRAKTIRQKWQRKQSYYVKKLAAMKPVQA